VRRSGSELSPALTLDAAHARRFLLLHQHLLPARSHEGPQGMLDFIAHVGCIQFDPIDIVGRNPDLVLQARCANYNPAWLERLMHKEHKLLVGWDKMSSVYRREDWPHFARHRAKMVSQHGAPDNPPIKLASHVLDEIRARGPLSSRDIAHSGRTDWAWGRTIGLVTATLEILFAMGAVLIHHRMRSVRYFDLAERILPPEVLHAPDPYLRDEDHQDWHVLRRIGSLGLATATGAGDYWYGINGVQSTPARMTVISRLIARGEVVPVDVASTPNRLFLIRTSDLPTLEAAEKPLDEPPQAAFIAPLDNLTWDRSLLRQLFDFDYAWEVYKPKAKRTYGYYVLPVLYGDRFVARAEPILDRKTRRLTIAGWWWESGVRPDATMKTALADSVAAFARYLGADFVDLGQALSGNRKRAIK